MSAGLPGLGLGGLFFIVSALLAPIGELRRTLRGRSRPGAWRLVGRQFAQALTMVIAIDLTLRLTYVLLSLVGIGDVPSAVSGTVLPLTLIGITSALLLVVLALAKLAELRLRLAGGERPRIPQALPRPHPVRALAYGSAVAVAWVALLSVGAAELSPLSRPPRERAPEVRTDDAARRAPASDAAPGGGRDPGATGPADRAAPTAGGGGSSGEEGPSGKGGAQPTSPPPSVSPPAPAPAGGQPGGKPPQAASGGPKAPPSQAPPAAAPTGPPASAGPPEESPAPEEAGPPEGSPAPEHAGPPEGSPAPEQAGPGKP